MLVGRQTEQRRLAALVSGARIGQSGVLVLVGEAGIGKTALLDAAADGASGMRVLRVTGSEDEQNLPFAALTQLLRPTQAELESLPAPQAEALGIALALRTGHGVDRFAVGAAALTLVTQCSESQPLALLVDDAQLVDRPSQEVIAFVARRLLADPVVLVAAVRAGEPCALLAPDLPRLVLPGLSEAATAELVAARLDRPPAAALAGRVHELSGGNPLAILELAADAQQVRALWPWAPGPVPAALTAVYARRSSSLGTAAREVVLLAAVAGGDLPVVARACQVRGLELDALAEAEQAGLVLLDGDRVRFTHPLARSALYSLATAPERRRLHQTIASVLSEAEADRRAWHRSEAALGPDDDTAVDVQALGSRAAARGAFAVATTAFERAAQLSTGDRDRAVRLLAAGEAGWAAGDGPRARTLLEASLRTAAAAVGARAQRLLGVIALRSGSITEARSTLVDAARSSAELDTDEALVCWAGVVEACFYLGDAGGALAAAEQIEQLLLGHPRGRQAAVATIAAGMARVLAGMGGADLIREGMQSLAQLPTAPVASAMLGDDAAWSLAGPLFLRESGTGRDLVRQAIDSRRREAALGSLPHLLFHLARDQAAGDRWPQAEADYGEAIALARESGQSTELAASSAGLAWLLARQGRAADTRRHAAEAERLGVQHEIHLARIWARHALADLALALGQVEEAVTLYTDLADLLSRLGVRDVDLSPVPELVEGLLRSGQADAAQRVAAPHQEQAEAKGQPWALARAARVRAVLGPDEDVDARFAAALALHAATLDTFETACTELAYGARLRRMRRRVDARPPLQRALQEFSRLGALPWAERSADELVATGTTALRAGASASSQLTPRELQVALLLVDGRTIRDAAAALFLSPKTVEYHLRHVYTKLDVGSRAALVDRLGPSEALLGPAPPVTGRV
ncbi:MAG: AAA family ATPase [Friedmanniella sp.]